MLFLQTGCSDDSNQTKQSPPLPEVKTHTLKPQNIPITVELPARSSAYRISEVRPQVNGIVLARMFTEGSDVTEGQQLYQIDPAIYEANYETALAQQKKAEANLTNTKLTADRYSKIVESKAVSRQDYDTAMANYRLAQAEMSAAQAAVKTARINLDYTKVFAPVSGRIGLSSVTEGTLVTAGQGTPLSIIQQMDPINIDIVQSSSEYLKMLRSIKDGSLVPGKPGEIEVDLTLEDGKPYSQTARLKIFDVFVDQGTGSITMRAEVSNPDKFILPGMFLHATIHKGEIRNALLVPQQAVQRNQKGQPYALVVDEAGTVEPRVFDASLGSFDNSWISRTGLYTAHNAPVKPEEVKDLRAAGKPVMGFLPEEKIIMEGSLKLRGGTKVRTVDFATAAGNEPAKAGQVQ
ncbi:MAG: efflux RND transporter periplasmic adaptor subunit [Deltaproteobacteria bacterium]|jgi:membrane fusion protein (multidrug efflux system)|nr:efflux RND transporter periplasmic adaptor subunit [Deltaproteobacteria bacterium]